MPGFAMKHLLLFSIIGLLNGLFVYSQIPSPSPPFAASADSHSDKTRPVRIPRFESEPVIDGQLNEDIWKSAVVLKDFYQLKSGVNVPSTLPTEVLLGYTDNYLYVGFRAFDKPRAAIWASLSRRDEIFGDDTVRLVLDTFNDKKKAYVFTFNPKGVVADGILTEGSGEDYSINIPVESKGIITGTGYIVEAAIPFKSLRYKAGKDRLWGINVFRNIKNLNNELNSWMPISPNKLGQLNQAGQLSGLENISTKPTIEVISSLTVSKNQSRVKSGNGVGGINGALNTNTRVSGQPLKIGPGFRAKIGFNPALTLKIAVNPDYLAGTELFQSSSYQQRKRAALDPDYAIKRTRAIRRFAYDDNYLESINNFHTPLNIVSKYAIVDPDYVIDLSGKLKSNSFDLLLVRDPAPGNFSLQDLENPQIRARADRYINKRAFLNAFRVKRDIGNDSSLGLIATAYNFAGTRSYASGLDGRLRLDDSSFINFQILGVNSKRPYFEPDLGEDVSRTGNGVGYFVNYERQKRHFGISVSAEGRTKYYRADLGFTRRFNYNRNAATIKYKSDTNPQAKLVNFQLLNTSDIGYDWQGRLRFFSSESKLDVSLPRETYLSIAYGGGYERLFEEDFGPRRGFNRPGAFIGGSERSTRFKGLSFYGESTPNERLFVSAFASYKWGEFQCVSCGRSFHSASLHHSFSPSLISVRS